VKQNIGQRSRFFLREEPTFLFLVLHCNGNCIQGDIKIEDFERIARMDEVTPARPKRVTVGAREIVLFRVGNEIFAVENLCPH
jgi:hypothetical protein